MSVTPVSAVAPQSATAPQVEPLSLTDGKVVAVHAKCQKVEGNPLLSDACLLFHLPQPMRDLSLSYLAITDKINVCRNCALGLPMALSIDTGWEPQECTWENVRDLFVSKVKDFAGAAYSRLNAYKTNLKALQGGPWYANDYYVALKATNQTARLKALQKNGSFYSGRPPTGLNRIPDPSEHHGTMLFSYALIQNIPASEALMNIKETLCFIDCQGALEIAYFDVLLEVLGKRRFDHLFKYNQDYRLCIHTRIDRSSVALFLNRTVHHDAGTLGKRPIKKGEMGYFANIEAYHHKHPMGEMGGLHVCCIQETPQQKFTAFGLPPEGLNEEEILDLLVKEYNAEPLTREELVSAELAKKLHANKRPVSFPSTITKEMLNKDPKAGFVRLVIRPNHAKLAKILPAPLEKLDALVT
jgi:hypothetical protein